MLQGPDRDSLVVLRGRRDILEDGAYVGWRSMRLETQDTFPRMERYLDLPMPESEPEYTPRARLEGNVDGACVVV
jgi:hypothetical protein